MDEINNFETLKKVADGIQKHKDELGVKGAFTSAGMDSSSDWRFKTHLANLPIYYEYKDEGITSTDAIKGTYLENYKNIWDLYITDSTCEPSMISSKTAEDASSEFALGEAVFIRMEPGHTTTSRIWKLPMRTWECFDLHRCQRRRRAGTLHGI